MARSRNHCHGSATVRFLCSLSVINVTTVASVAMETQQLLRYTCGSQQYETHVGLHLKYSFLSDFHQIWGSSTDFRKRHQYKFSRKSVQGEPRLYLMSDMTKPIGAFGYLFEAA